MGLNVRSYPVSLVVLAFFLSFCPRFHGCPGLAPASDLAKIMEAQVKDPHAPNTRMCYDGHRNEAR